MTSSVGIGTDDVEPDEQLLERLRAQLVARRAELDAEVARAQEEAAVTVAAAHRAARVITSRAKLTAPVAPVVPEPPALVPGPIALTEPVVVPEPLPLIVAATPVTATPVTPAAQAADTFDREEMATMFATLLDERMSRWAPGEQPRTPSFWSHVFHADVIIVTLVMVFCLVVVAAWMS